jgi:hypothetical protein
MEISRSSLFIAVTAALLILCSGCAAQRATANIPAGPSVGQVTNTIPAGPSVVTTKH